MVGDFVVANGHQTVAVCWSLLTRSPLFGGMDAWFFSHRHLFPRMATCCVALAGGRFGPNGRSALGLISGRPRGKVNRLVFLKKL